MGLGKSKILSQAASGVDASFGIVTYQTDGSYDNITGVGFQPDLVWIKRRNGGGNHYLFDSVRGVHKAIFPDESYDQADNGNYLTAFESDGFALGSAAAGANSALVGNGNTYVAWNWKAGGAASSNTNGTITSSVSANQDAGFSIVKYTATGTTATVGHGLSSAPELILSKTTSAAYDWLVYAAPVGETKQMRLNANTAAATSGFMNNTAPTSSVYTVASGNNMNYANGDINVAYCFTSISGYQKIGSYTGQTSGVTITTGFRPRFIMVKASQSTYVENWAILDTVRGSGKCLNPNLAGAESDSALNTFTVSDTGFSFPHQSTADAMLNENGYEYIYLAIA